MADPALPPTTAPRRRRGGLTRVQKIGLGLLLTLVGLFLLSILLPTAPGEQAKFLPVAGVGIVALWVGGILMGVGSRS